MSVPPFDRVHHLAADEEREVQVVAGGDHLHFTLLVGGQMVNPVEWWDSHWIADRVERKLKEAR